MFSIVYGVVFQPLPYDEPDRIVRLEPHKDNEDGSGWSGANFIDFVERSDAFEAIAGYRAFHFSLNDGKYPASFRGACVTAGFFDVLGVPATLGRALSPEIDKPGAEPTVVLSHGLWQSAFGGDPQIIGKPVNLNGVTFTAVGVMPAGFAFPERMMLWYHSKYRVPEPPFDFGTSPEEVRGAEYFSTIARLKTDMSFARAQQESSAIVSSLATQYPDSNFALEVRLLPLSEFVVGTVRPALLSLFGAVGFVLLIACVNVANLMLVRASDRRREIAVRRALGARTMRLARQLLAESVMLGLAGGFVGLLLSVWGTEALVTLAASQLPRAAEVGINGVVFAFSVLVAVGCGLLFGLVPVLQAHKQQPATVLRGEEGRHTGGVARNRLRRVLVAFEIAISVVLLVGAGLMIRTLASVAAADPGFSEREALTARLFIPSTKYAEDDEVREFYRESLRRIRDLPGVRSAAGTLSLPISAGINGDLIFIIDGRSFEEGNEPVAGYQAATDGYFETIGIPLKRGRTFTSADRNGSPLVAILSEAAAEQFFPGEDPIGERISWSGDTQDPEFEWVTIVGVVGNTLHNGLDTTPRSEIYQPFDQAPLPFLTLVIRTQANPEAMTTTLRRTVMEIDPEQPLVQIRTLNEVLHESLARRRFNMVVMSVFAGLALLMAAVGLYGVLSYAVAQRGREIGIRMALGATSWRIIRQVVEEGAPPVLMGLGVGVMASLGFSKLIAGLVHGIPPLDPVAFTLGALVLCLMSVIASMMPAVRATQVNPVDSLRQE
jgi:putative ABC transport system permease protein